MTDALVGGVVVVGAGAAGLSAAAHLRALGVTVTLLEAGPCIGGRARTARPAALDGEVLDLGAAWLHAADSNPLVGLAMPEDGLVNSDALRTERLFVAGREATAAEHEEYDACWDAVERLEPGAADTSLAALMAAVPGPWAPTVALWEGAIIAAADADDLSAQDWRRNLLPPPNLLPPGGLGDFVARRLATPAWLDTPATRIAWDGPGVRVDTPRGTLQAAACILTVSTGVLAAGAIRFDPPLPAAVEAAADALPMGLATKVALPAVDGGRLGIADNSTLVRQVAAGEAGMTFNAWPLGRGHLAGYMGGRTAWAVAGDDAAAEAFAREQLRAMLGPVRLGMRAVVTAWGTDPLFRGAYSYARPGHVGARAALAKAFPGERLLFAGEATRTDGLAGTVGGAWLSGRDAAARLLGEDGQAR
jgi:monoamine oxidase